MQSFFPPLLISWYLKIRTEGKLCAQTNCQNIPFRRELTGNQFTHRNKYTNQHPLLKTTALPIICLSSSVPKVSQSNAAQHPKVVVGDRDQNFDNLHRLRAVFRAKYISRIFRVWFVKTTRLLLPRCQKLGLGLYTLYMIDQPVSICR